MAKVLEHSHKYTDVGGRELAWKLTDEAGFSVAESTSIVPSCKQGGFAELTGERSRVIEHFLEQFLSEFMPKWAYKWLVGTSSLLGH